MGGSKPRCVISIAQGSDLCGSRVAAVPPSILQEFCQHGRNSQSESHGSPRRGQARLQGADKGYINVLREGHIYAALKMVSSFDKESQSYQQPQPKITCMVDGKYIRMPIDASLIKRFGDFLIKLGDVLEGVEIPQREIDMDEVRKKMRSFQQRLIDD